MLSLNRGIWSFLCVYNTRLTWEKRNKPQQQRDNQETTSLKARFYANEFFRIIHVRFLSIDAASKFRSTLENKLNKSPDSC